MARYQPPKIPSSVVLGIGILLIVSAFTYSLSNPRILTLLAAATSSLTGAPATLYFTPYDENTLSLGQTTAMDVNVRAEVPINAIGTTIVFPQDMLEIVMINKKKSVLDLWTEETAIKEDIGEVHFSGGSLREGGLIGTGTALTISVRAKKSGEATLYFKDAQIYPSDGSGMPLASDARSITYHIAAVSPVGGAPAATPPPDTDILIVPRSADLNDDGSVSMIDASILIVRMFMDYEAQYDIDMDGSIGLSDLSILFSKMRQM